ncbi:hypothetical protein GCM10019059_32110 [Camelimonas fluminis]|uniref:Helix-turn-helix domain-containing protein n=1 Tax=Camelimonas fluminis TaxID=1576911 RepID=A0ABV7UHL9_9HYPH|nr:helix-turn-helix transcriptional regulator [Camelimonas fluminis]GHE69938.1 hypothetical protein GCM10019059_32110 [Camelimonas fluminis]
MNDVNPNSQFGLLLRQLRADAGMSQEMAAKLFAVSQPAYSRIERGETQITIEMLLKASRIFSVPIPRLVSVGKGDVAPGELSEDVSRIARKMMNIHGRKPLKIIEDLVDYVNSASPWPRVATRMLETAPTDEPVPSWNKPKDAE